MDDSLISAETTVERMLRLNPKASKVFIQNQTACVGCYLAHFCTLEDVANAYRLSLERFLEELQPDVPLEHPSLSGEKYEQKI